MHILYIDALCTNQHPSIIIWFWLHCISWYDSHVSYHFKWSIFLVVDTDYSYRNIIPFFSDKEFGRMHNLQGHTHVHNNSRPFKCSICQSSFTLKGMSGLCWFAMLITNDTTIHTTMSQIYTNIQCMENKIMYR